MSEETKDETVEVIEASELGGIFLKVKRYKGGGEWETIEIKKKQPQELFEYVLKNFVNTNKNLTTTLCEQLSLQQGVQEVRVKPHDGYIVVGDTIVEGMGPARIIIVVD